MLLYVMVVGQWELLLVFFLHMFSVKTRQADMYVCFGVGGEVCVEASEPPTHISFYLH